MPDSDPAPAQRSLVEKKDAFVLALGTLMGGGGVSAFFNGDASALSGSDVQTALARLSDWFGTLGLYQRLGGAAVIGAVIGLAYSLYHNNWSLLLPRPALDRSKGTLSLSRWGCLDEVLLSAALAVLAAWGKSPDNASSGSPGSTLAIVAGAALVGARMRCGYDDRDVLREALVQTVGQPASPERKAAVEDAATSTAAAQIAVGEIPLPPALRKLLDPTALSTQGKQIVRDGVGLTLGILAQHTVLDDRLKPFVKDMRLPESATMTEADFLAAVGRNGIDVSAFQPALVAVHKAAGQVMKELQALPT